MKDSNNNTELTGCVTRRKFCKLVPCAAAGIVGSSSIFTSYLEGSTIENEILSSKEISMANIITAKVISQKGTCDAGHKVGDEVVFKEDGVEGKICIHALYSILPKVFAMMFDSQFPWLKDPNVSTSACPDAYNPLIFEISRKKED
jgi:uncharacterized repeat protein (TIGR04076 family)